ncbi:MAG: DUF998 domain-containing protein [Thermoplasmata archaeon]
MEETKKTQPYTVRKNTGIGFAAGGTLAILAITVAEAIYPTYSSRNDAISYLGGAGVPTELFWDSAVVVVGCLWLWGTFNLFRGSHRKVSPIFFTLTGIGFLLVGLSPWNQSPITHYIGANFIFLFGSLSAISASRFTSGAMVKLSILSGFLSLGAYVSGYFGSYYILGPGGIERMIFYPILLWSIAFGGYALNAHGLRMTLT